MYKRNAQPYNYTPDATTSSTASAAARSPQPYASSSSSSASTASTINLGPRTSQAYTTPSNVTPSPINIAPRASQAYNATVSNASTSTANAAKQNTQTYSYNPGKSSSSSSSTSSSSNNLVRLSWDFTVAKFTGQPNNFCFEAMRTAITTRLLNTDEIYETLKSFGVLDAIAAFESVDTTFNFTITQGTQTRVIASIVDLRTYVDSVKGIAGPTASSPRP